MGGVLLDFVDAGREGKVMGGVFSDFAAAGEEIWVEYFLDFVAAAWGGYG